MSDITILGKRRTIRFAAEVDRLLSSKATAENKSVSRVIRDSVLANLRSYQPSAAKWILSVADNPPRPVSSKRLAFRKKYLQKISCAPPMNAILDASALIAAWDKAGKNHNWAVAIL